MTRLDQIRLKRNEERVARTIAIPLVLVLSILFYIGKLILKALWRVRRALWKLSVAIGVVLFLTSAIGVLRANAPKANATAPVLPIREQTQQDQIKAYIRQVFGNQASNAFKILACENHSLNPNAVGHNSNGTVDTGIFQINSFWANPAVLTDWKTNVDMAYQIYLRGGWNEWACEYVWHALERNDTI